MSWVDTLPCPASEELYVVFWSARSTSRVKFGQSWRKFSSQTREISCATPATQKRRRPNGTRGTPGRTSDPLAMHLVPRLPRKSGNARCATPATQKRRRPNGTRGTPEGRQGVHPTPCQCTLWDQMTPEGRQGVHPTPFAKHVVPRLPRKSGGDQGAPAAETKWHRAYIPLAMHVVPRLPRKSGEKTKWHQRDARGTPGRTSDPLAMSEWVSVVCVWVSEGDWVCVCVSDVWVSEWASERVSVCVWVMWCESEWVSEWVWCVCEWWCESEWVSVVCLGEWVMLKWVSEWGSVRECEGGGTGRKERIQN